MISLENTKWIHAELSSNCQAACPLCARNDYGFKNRTDFPVTELSIAQWASIFDPYDFKKIKFIYFNGNYGDPLMAKDIVEITDYCFKKWPKVNVRISTNGGIRNEEWWENYAKKFNHNKLTTIFSIDGLKDTNHLYRVNVPYEKALANARAFIAGGGEAVWKFIKFRHNEHQVEIARKLSIDLGFSSFELIDDSRDKGFVFTSESEGYWIMPASDKDPSSPPRRPDKFAEKEYVTTDDGIIGYLEDKWRKNDKNIECFVKNDQTFYIAANGEVYPCCFTGFFPREYKGWYTNFNEVFGDVENNALKVGLEKAVGWFNRVEESWKKDSVCDGILSTCLNCSKDWRTKKEFKNDIN